MRKGFTVAELLVSMGIIIVITGLMLANFQTGQQFSEVRFASDVLVNQMRELQSEALSGKLISVCSGGGNANKVCESGVNIDCTVGGGSCQKRVVNGYGIHLAAAGDPANNTYTVFYDTVGSGVYALGEALTTQPFVSTGRVYLLSSVPAAPLDIVFKPPDGAVFINGAQAASSATMTLKYSTKAIQRDVSVYRITGKIEHD